MNLILRGALVYIGLAFMHVTTASAQGNPAIEGGIRLVEQGNRAQGIEQLGAQLERSSLSGAQRVRALVFLARAYLELGDLPSARPIIAEAARLEPCLMPSAETHSLEWRDLYLRARPAGARCDVSAFRATAKSLVLPGWGLRETGRDGKARAFLLGIAAVGAYAGYSRVMAAEEYSRYQSATYGLEAQEAYDAAESAYTQSLIGAGAVAVLWAANVISTYRTTHREQGRLRAVVDFDGTAGAYNPVRIGLAIPTGVLR